MLHMYFDRLTIKYRYYSMFRFSSKTATQMWVVEMFGGLSRTDMFHRRGSYNAPLPEPYTLPPLPSEHKPRYLHMYAPTICHRGRIPWGGGEAWHIYAVLHFWWTWPKNLSAIKPSFFSTCKVTQNCCITLGSLQSCWMSFSLEAKWQKPLPCHAEITESIRVSNIKWELNTVHISGNLFRMSWGCEPSKQRIPPENTWWYSFVEKALLEQ